MTVKKVGVSYSAGFLVCRLIDIDDSEGEHRIVPGVHARLRCVRVDAYNVAEPGVLEVWMAVRREPFVIVGTMAEIEKAMQRGEMLSSVPRHDGDGKED